MACSATTVLPAPVGAATSTDAPSSRAATACRWKSSSSKGYGARAGPPGAGPPGRGTGGSGVTPPAPFAARRLAMKLPMRIEIS